jgi:glutamate-5-semialdehyde dehydrogenase
VPAHTPPGEGPQGRVLHRARDQRHPTGGGAGAPADLAHQRVDVLGAAPAILAANAADLDEGRAKGLTAASLDRLALNPARVAAVTLGRLSKITPTTPSGVATRSIRRPFGRA